MNTAVNLLLRAIDPDAAAFCGRSGATERQNISRFSRGMKALVGWENFVCWFGRSSQNAGTGTIVHSFGGFGSFDGTLANGPTWGPTGITASGTQIVNTALTISGAAVQTVFAVTNVPAIGTGYVRHYSAGTASGTTARQGVTDSSGGTATRDNFFNGSTTITGVVPTYGVFRLRSWTYDGSSIHIGKYEPAETIASGVITCNTNATPVSFGGNFTSTVLSTTHALVIDVRLALTSAQRITVYALIRDTIGQGLSLP